MASLCQRSRSSQTSLSSASALVIIESCETLLSAMPEFNVLLKAGAACLCPTGCFFVGPTAPAKRNISSLLMWISRDHFTTRTPVNGEALNSLRPIR